MSEGKLDPSVKEFKAFVQQHPKMVEVVRKKNETWQSYYEKWVLLGEDDEYWNDFKGEVGAEKLVEDNAEPTKQTNQQADQDSENQLFTQFMNLIENVDLNKVEGHIHQLSSAIDNVQVLVNQFQDMKSSGISKQQKRSPFQFGRD
ncbi:spore coat protein YlbD [Pontibacillus litoralis]|uniref:Coat protein n=1 Tax=Pontibacillus litoralis JSM 072002 TaxID=1385512 RepID=A0A0A5GBU9_9BACI|nr:spore coat protein YlbD [Pontibacillus litoralis]KGX88570.1 hypothetical protein N784_07825 [Pontibacillus litoralis JSM 072002]